MAEVVVPKKSRVLCVRLEQDLYDALRRAGRSFGVSPMVYARGILEDFYDQYLADGNEVLEDD